MIVDSRTSAFGEEVQRRILIGTFVLSSGYYDAYYNSALKARRVIKDDFDAVFSKYDVILSPTTPTPAFKLGENATSPMEMYMNDIATIPANMAGLPALSVPCGRVNGMPVGFQLVGRALDEQTILKMGHLYQQEVGLYSYSGDPS